jgi:hypothetical protein
MSDLRVVIDDQDVILMAVHGTYYQRFFSVHVKEKCNAG